MRAFRRALILMIVALTVDVSALSLSRQSKEAKEPTGSIAGRVTVDGKPARKIFVTLVQAERNSQQQNTGKATTDEEGNFKFARVPAGSYTVQAYAPALTGLDDGIQGQPGKGVFLAEGEAVEGVDIRLERGGVITGRITDSSGNPLIEEQVVLIAIDQRGQKRRIHLPLDYSIMHTDDRGIYRIYGLPAGRYIVAAGVAKEDAVFRSSGGGVNHTRTYHPDVTDISLAKIVDVQPSGEQSNIDIVIGGSLKTFTATGRIVDAATGKPVANVNYGVAIRVSSDEGSFSGSTITSNRSNERGEFRLEGLSPGKYAAIAHFEPPADSYYEPAAFEVVDGDVSGLLIKIRRGASVSGQVVIDGMNEKQAASLMSHLQMSAGVQSSEPIVGSIASQSAIQPDGSFRITGLPAGKVKFYVVRYPPGEGFNPRRTERDGIEQSEGVEVSAGEHVSGIKVFVSYGTGSIRGQVKIEGGELPEGAQVFVSARDSDGNRRSSQVVKADVRGNFLIQHLAPGEYELNASAHDVIGQKPIYVKPSRQKVAVSNDEETQVTVTLEFVKRRDARQ